MLALVHVMTIALPTSPFLTLVFGFVGVFVLVRIAIRIIEALPG